MRPCRVPAMTVISEAAVVPTSALRRETDQPAGELLCVIAIERIDVYRERIDTLNPVMQAADRRRRGCRHRAAPGARRSAGMDPWERWARWSLVVGEVAVAACVAGVALLLVFMLRQVAT